MCPFSYWRAREGNSECTGVVNVIKVPRQKDIFMGKSQKDMTCVVLAIGEQEREIQNAQVLSISSKSGDKKKKKK